MSEGLVDLDVLVRAAGSLQPLPPSAARLAGLVSSPDWELEEVVGVIKLDPALTGRVLRAANSAALGGVSTIHDVSEATMRLGAGTVSGLAVGSAMRGAFSEPLPAYGAAAGALWRHSVAAALATDCMRRFASRPIPSEAYTVALLHDIGKLILAQHVDENVHQILKQAETERGWAQVMAESELLEMNHGELGALVAQHWKLPPSVVQAIVFHHDPSAIEDENVVRVCEAVHLADCISKEIGEGLGQTPPQRSRHAAIRERLGISEEGYEELCETVVLRFDETLGAYA